MAVILVSAQVLWVLTLKFGLGLDNISSFNFKEVDPFNNWIPDLLPLQYKLPWHFAGLLENRQTQRPSLASCHGSYARPTIWIARNRNMREKINKLRIF